MLATSSTPWSVPPRVCGRRAWVGPANNAVVARSATVQQATSTPSITSQLCQSPPDTPCATWPAIVSVLMVTTVRDVIGETGIGRVKVR